MLKKSLAILGAVGITGAVLFAGSTSASADEYPVFGTCTAQPAAVLPGAATTITCTGLDPNFFDELGFYVSGAGVVEGSLGSLVAALPEGDSYTEVRLDDEGSASVVFTAPLVTESTTYTVEINAYGDKDREALEPVVVTVAPASTTPTTPPTTPPSATLPATGGDFPAAALWLGLGAVGIGGIAVTAAVARRRAAGQR